MSSQNHTSIQHIVDAHEESKKKQSGQSMISFGKEGEPIEVAPEKKKATEVTFEESEPTVEDKELKEFIKVEKAPVIELDPKLKKAGLAAIDTASLDPRHRVHLPLSDEKVVEGLEQPLNSSWRWLAEYAMFLLHRAHLNLKKIHGHVVRVMMK